MSKKPLPYGISDFKDVIENYYYIDKTMFIPKLEQEGRFLYLIRPRRFGKSLFYNMLDFYYNVRWKEHFDLLKDCYIYKHPTKEKNSYHILKFDFSAVSTIGNINENFSYYCNSQIRKFINTYDIDFNLDEKRAAHTNLNDLFIFLKQTLPDIKIYILIDEYDNFINNLLMNNKKLYEQMVSSQEAIYKEFFKLLKALTNENDSPLKRMFFTGVNPLALFVLPSVRDSALLHDVTSGSNIGINITNKYHFNDIIGVTKDEFKRLIEYYELQDHFTDEKIAFLDSWYNNYKFSEDIDHTIYNTDMILYYTKELVISKRVPNELVDINVRTDYTKLKYLVHTNNRLNGNFDVLKTLFADGFITVDTIKDSFSAFELTKEENFISLLYYLGLVTIDKVEFGDLKLHIPNQTIRRIMAEFINTMLEDTKTLEIDLREFHKGMKDFCI